MTASFRPVNLLAALRKRDFLNKALQSFTVRPCSGCRLSRRSGRSSFRIRVPLTNYIIELACKLQAEALCVILHYSSVEFPNTDPKSKNKPGNLSYPDRYKHCHSCRLTQLVIDSCTQYVALRPRPVSVIKSLAKRKPLTVMDTSIPRCLQNLSAANNVIAQQRHVQRFGAEENDPRNC